jgi:hypothetical protein
MTVASIEFFGIERKSNRSLFVIEADRPEDVPSEIDVPGPNFVCFLAWDTHELEVSVIAAVAERLLRAGCVYACCWGPGCSRAHDIFDEVELELRPGGPWALTTLHPRESLASALWFAMFSSWPEETFTKSCRSVVAISIGSTKWATEIRDAFQDTAKFNARVRLTDEYGYPP